jgi:hypothetical protein
LLSFDDGDPMLLKPLPNMSDIEKEHHPSLRRSTRKYRKKQRIVRDLWIVSGLLMLCVPANVMLAFALGTTCLAFVILDETP